MLIDKLLAQVAPHDCLGCSTEGKLLCKACIAQITQIPPACYRCCRLSDFARTCSSCRTHTDLFAVRAAAVYEGLAKDLVWQLKFQGVQAAAHEMAVLLAPFVPRQANFVLVPVPTATSRMRQRGYDQATLIAKHLSLLTGVPYAPVLRRSGQHHQVGSTRTQRIHQLQQAYRVASPGAISDKQILLIDDVLTTGATLEAAAQVVKVAGAKRVSGLVFARA